MSHKILFNPESGSLIRGFAWEGTRVDLPVGEDSVAIPDNVAHEMMKRYPWLEEKEYKEIGFDLSDGGKTLKDIPGIGEASIERLGKFEIYTPEEFFENMDKDPELMKKILGPVVFAKFAPEEE